MISVSVVIPAFNEEKNIVTLLNELYVQATRKPDEIVVVDANSTDMTAAYTIEWKNKHPDCNLKLIQLKNTAYPGRARNAGVQNSGYDYIAFIDCGVIPDTDWLNNIVQAFEKDPLIEVVWARSKSKAITTWENAFAAVIERYNSIERSVRSSCVKKDSFYLIGMFREDLRAGEDLLYKNAIKDFNLREEFVPVDAWYTGYPDSFKSAFEKWILYSEYSVFAGIYKSKLLLSLIELTGFLSILIISIAIFRSIILGIVGIATLTLIRLIISMKKSQVKIKSIKGYILAAGIMISTDAGRIAGLIIGLIKKFKVKF